MRLLRTQGRASKQTAILLAQLENRSGTSLDSVLPTVRKILSKVRKEGDKALLTYTKKFDSLALNTPLLISEEETKAAWQQLDPTLQQALQTAAKNIHN